MGTYQVRLRTSTGGQQPINVDAGSTHEAVRNAVEVANANQAAYLSAGYTVDTTDNGHAEVDQLT